MENSIIQLDAFESEFDKTIKVKPSIRKGFAPLRSKLRALYREVGDYNYAQQFIEAQSQPDDLIKKRWGDDVEKKTLLSMFYTAVWEHNDYGGSFEKWLLHVKQYGY